MPDFIDEITLDYTIKCLKEQRSTLRSNKLKIDILEDKNKALIKALNYIRACDNATQSAAKAIETLKKYENL